ncbi:hypothetical protein SK128_012487 [Halocaridina rubra]|uniref:Uncharacterized protein n=1 Tax=Halocaridina rubra TaxID=373956 RepID=A0AAN8XFV9_HALRR
MAEVSTISFVVLTLLFIASVTKAAAIKTTSGMPRNMSNFYENKDLLRIRQYTSEIEPNFQLPEPMSSDSRSQLPSNIRLSTVNEYSKPSGSVKEHRKKSTKRGFPFVQKSKNLPPASLSKQLIKTNNLDDEKSRCSFQSWPIGPLYDKIRLKNPDPFTEYLQNTRANQEIGNPSNADISLRREIPEPNLPMGCASSEGMDIIVCSGRNFTAVPEFKIRKVNAIKFINTAIAHVSQDHTDNLPRTIVRLTFQEGILTSFDGRNLKYIDGLETLSLAQNALATFSFAMVFQDDGNDCCNNTIKYLDLRDNYMSYPYQTGLNVTFQRGNPGVENYPPRPLSHTVLEWLMRRISQAILVNANYIEISVVRRQVSVTRHTDNKKESPA